MWRLCWHVYKSTCPDAPFLKPRTERQFGFSSNKIEDGRDRCRVGSKLMAGGKAEGYHFGQVVIANRSADHAFVRDRNFLCNIAVKSNGFHIAIVNAGASSMKKINR